MLWLLNGSELCARGIFSRQITAVPNGLTSSETAICLSHCFNGFRDTRKARDLAMLDDIGRGHGSLANGSHSTVRSIGRR